MAVHFALSDFVTGGPIIDLPINEGASWASPLNRPDAVSCVIDMRNPDALALDLPAASEPNKTILSARTDDDVFLAWGIIGDGDRVWDEDARELTLSASGVSAAGYFGRTIIAPASALTAPLITLDAEGYPVVNPALDTNLSGWSLGTIGKKLVAQRLAFPGAPTIFDLPADQAGTHERSYLFSGLKSIGKALDDLTNVENGPDFAFDAYRDTDGISLRAVMRHGSEAEPRIGTDVGSWSLGEGSPITGLSITDALTAGASAGWMSAGKTSGAPILSRVLNSVMISRGYPPFDIVDTSHNDVSDQSTLDAYNRQNVADAASVARDLTFYVRGDARPSLGEYRSGDTATLDVPEGHPWHRAGIPIRITSIGGDETGETVEIGCVILDG
jgi:hypothetical protein